MAELPDLTVYAKILSRKFKGKVLDTLHISLAKKLNVSAKTLKKALEGNELLEVAQVGKTVNFLFSGSQVLKIHLMLRGEYIFWDNDEPPKYQIMGFHFEGGEGFAVIDILKQAKITLNPTELNIPDILKMKFDYFKKQLISKKTNIKKLLMDQHIMQGVGNSYADEILYHAGISPKSIAGALPENEVEKLYNSIGIVLKRAIVDIENENVNELTGELRDFMQVHNPKLKSTLKGEIIRSEKIGGRKSYFTDSQKIFN